MAEQYPTDAELNALSGTTLGAGILTPEKNKDPHYVDLAKVWKRIADALIPLTGCEVYKDGDLTFAVRAGKYLNGDTEVNYAGAAAQALTDDATNYIYLTATGTLTKNTTGFPTPSATPHVPLATIVTASGNYSIDDGDITDYRQRAMLQVCRTPGLENIIADPGDAGAIPVADTGHCDIVTAGVETRTIAAPDKIGQEMLVSLKTDGGNCTITVATLINQTGNNTILMDDEGDSILLVAVAAGANKRWRVVYNDGCTLSTV